MKRTAKRSTVVGSVLALLLGAGVAFAAWTATGTGSGTANVDTAQALGVSAASVTELFPTGTVEVSVTVTNPNPYKVQLANVAFDSATTAKPGCDASVISSLGSGDLTDVLAADGGSAVIPVDVTMSNAATDECQGAAFTVTFTATGASTS